MVKLLHKYNRETIDLGDYESEQEALGAIKEWLLTKSTLRAQRWVEGKKNGLKFIDYGASNSCFFLKEI